MWGRKATQKDRSLIARMYVECKGNSREAHRRLNTEPYISEGQNFSFQTILKYWRQEGLKIRSRGGANHTRR